MKNGCAKILFVALAICVFTSFASAQTSTRTLPSTYSPGSSITINLTIGFNSTDCGGAVVESVPIGWNVTGISGQGAGYYNPSLGEITWAPINAPSCGGASANYTLGYMATPNSSQTGTQTFSGIFGVDGSSYSIGGSTSIDQQVSNSGSTTSPAAGGGGGGSSPTVPVQQTNSSPVSTVTIPSSQTNETQSQNLSTENQNTSAGVRLPVLSASSSRAFLIGLVIAILLVVIIITTVHIRRRRYSLGLREALEQVNQ